MSPKTLAISGKTLAALGAVLMALATIITTLTAKMVPNDTSALLAAFAVFLVAVSTYLAHKYPPQGA
jgi:hypothetical protein